MKKTNILKKMLAATMLLLVSAPSWCADGDVFKMSTKEGIEMTFKVISESEKTCQIGTDDKESPSISIYNGGTITLPASVLGYSVIRIADYAFYNCRYLTSVEIPNSVTSISYRAFNLCTGLTSIAISASVTSISIRAFEGCSGLTSIIVEEGNSVYDSRDNCNAIIETATNRLILGCENTIIPNSVTSIGEAAFKLCEGLTSITIPEGVTKIEMSAFSRCYNLSSVSIPESVTELGDFAFDFSAQTSIEIPTYVTSIGRYAFDANSKLISVTIPEGLTRIGEYAFNNCPSLTTVTFIGRSKLTTIGWEAFNDCRSLTSIELPSSITSIGGWAFRNCTSLTSVTMRNPSAIPIETYTFTNRTNATLYVVKGCKAEFENAPYWREFKQIIDTEILTPEVVGDANGDGKVTITDAVVVVNYILGTTQEKFDKLAADVSEDGEITITDAVGIVNIILNADSAGVKERREREEIVTEREPD